MNRKQEGFTLIELVVVLVLLGIIGAVATARFQDLSTQAADAVEEGFAGELSSGSAINYAARTLGNVATTIAIYGDGTTAFDCADAGPLLQSGVPTFITLTAIDDDCTDNSNDNIVTCGVQHDDGNDTTDATATLLCIQ